METQPTRLKFGGFLKQCLKQSLQVLNFITYAQGGLYGGVVGAIGGITGMSLGFALAVALSAFAPSLVSLLGIVALIVGWVFGKGT